MYYAILAKSFYSGSLVGGRTRHFFFLSRPDPAKKVEENGKQVEPVSQQTLYYDYSAKGGWYSSQEVVLYLFNEPVWCWERHRGSTGERSDDYDKIFQAQKLTREEVKRIEKEYDREIIIDAEIRHVDDNE